MHEDQQKGTGKVNVTDLILAEIRSVKEDLREHISTERKDTLRLQQTVDKIRDKQHIQNIEHNELKGTVRGLSAKVATGVSLVVAVFAALAKSFAGG